MDIVLERILSLIPKKENGDFVHGSKKEFCQKIDAPTNIVNAWVRGTNHSYRNYLYRIASEYDVSVEWLEGKTAKKNNHPTETGRVADKRTQRIFAFVDECSPEELSDLTKYIVFPHSTSFGVDADKYGFTHASSPPILSPPLRLPQ